MSRELASFHRPGPKGPDIFPPQDGTALFECAVCPRPTETKCGRCKSTLFCSRECQEMMWPTHKFLCNREGVRPQVFTQPPLTQEERDYIVTEFNYTSEKGKRLSETLEEQHGVNDPYFMIKCRHCYEDACEDRKAMLEQIDNMASAMLYRLETTPTSQVCQRHTWLVMLRASLLKRIKLDESRPEPSSSLRPFWALAGYEFCFTSKYQEAPPENNKPTSSKIRLAINRLLRHFLIDHTLAEQTRLTGYSKLISELAHVTALRIVEIVYEDGSRHGETVFELMQTWCIQNGHDMMEYMENVVEE